MMRRFAVLLFLAAGLCRPARAQAPPGVRACSTAAAAAPTGKLRREDIGEVFGALLAHSGYDAGASSTTGRGPTMLVPVPPPKERGALAEAASARRPGESSRVYVEERGLLRVLKTRGELAFILGHELAHLVNKDDDRFDAALDGLFAEWNSGEGGRLRESGASGAEIRSAREAFLKPRVESAEKALEDQADAKAQEWLGEVVDPRTGRVFGLDAACAALEAVKKDREAKHVHELPGPYASLGDRIAAAQRRADAARPKTTDLAPLANPAYDGR